MRVFRVAENVFGMEIDEYTNGVLTTAGLVPLDAEPVENVASVTYDSASAEYLPVTYHEHKWLDDRNKRQYIKHINFDAAGEMPAYTMEDGSVSWTVTS